MRNFHGRVLVFCCQIFQNSRFLLNTSSTPSTFCCSVWMTSTFAHETASQGTTHTQQVCRKSASSLHKVSSWSTGGLSMYNVNTPLRTTLLVLDGPTPHHSTKTVDKIHTTRQPSAQAAHEACRSLAPPRPIVPTMSSRRELFRHQG